MKYSKPCSPHQLYEPREKPVYEWGENLASQEFKDDCNTEKILEKYSQSGLPLPAIPVQAIYRDCTDMRNLQEHLNNARELLQNAEENFMQLDAKTRKKFNHDVATMAEWLADDDNKEESYKLGLRVRPTPSTQGEIIPPPPLPSTSQSPSNQTHPSQK